MILAIDIGGTSSKFGLVSLKGFSSPENSGKQDRQTGQVGQEVKAYQRFDTPEEMERSGLAGFLEARIGAYLQEFPDIKGIGIGLPGLLSKDRKEILLLPNIPSVERLPVVQLLKEKFPDLPVRIENDAKCAALGELHFGRHSQLEDFLLITLGTGIGSGVVIDRKLFTGARGNGLELGHILAGGRGKTLEEQIGLNGFLTRARQAMAAAGSAAAPEGGSGTANSGGEPATANPGKGPATAKELFEAARKGDALAIDLFAEMGDLLGEALVAAVRILDVTTIFLGGGVSGAFDYIVPALRDRLHRHLPEYYTADLQVKKASLGNHAGLLGAASLLTEH